MMVSVLHIRGIDHISRVLANFCYWLDTRGYLSRRSVPDTSPFDRGNYIKTFSSFGLRQTIAAFKGLRVQRGGLNPKSETFEKDTVCSEWGAANAKEEDLHGGVPTTICGADAGLPQHFCFGQGT